MPGQLVVKAAAQLQHGRDAACRHHLAHRGLVDAGDHLEERAFA